VWIEGVQKQVFPAQADRRCHQRRDDCTLHQIARADAEHVAEQDMVEVQIRLYAGVKDDPKSEHSRKYDA
jgi:hypothetical protein